MEHLPRSADLLFGLQTLLIRAAPFAIWAALDARMSRLARIAVPSAFSFLIALLVRFWPDEIVSLKWLLAAELYFLLCSCALFGSVPLIASRVLSRFALIVMCVFVFAVLPTLVAPQPAVAIAQLLGWPLMFAGYSYGVEAAVRGRGSLRDCLFFMLVNPTVVFAGADRGAPVVGAAEHSRGVARVGFSVCVLMAHATLFPHLVHEASELRVESAFERYAAAIAFYGVVALGEYIVLASSTSLKIGLMRAIGYSVPECFDYPLLARSPKEFWRRWNRYYAHWAQRYVFVPTALRLRRVFRTSRLAVTTLAVLVTFLSMGALHDLAGFLRDPRTLPTGMTVFFFANGIFLVLWELVAAGAAARQATTTPLTMPRRRVAVIASHVFFVQTMLGLVALAIG